MSSIHKKGEFTKIFLITFKLLRQCFRLFFKIFTSLILYWAWTWPYLTFWPLSFLDFWVIKNGMHEIDWARVDWDRSTDEIQYRPVPNVAPFTFLIRGDSQIHIKNTVLRTLYYDNNEPMTSSLPYVSIVSGHPTYRIQHGYLDRNSEHTWDFGRPYFIKNWSRGFHDTRLN